MSFCVATSFAQYKSVLHQPNDTRSMKKHKRVHHGILLPTESSTIFLSASCVRLPMFFSITSWALPMFSNSTKDINAYPPVATEPQRSKVGRIGKFRRRREMLRRAVSDEAQSLQVDSLQRITLASTILVALLKAEEQKLMAEGKHIYWAMASIHSPKRLSGHAHGTSIPSRGEDTPFIHKNSRDAIRLI